MIERDYAKRVTRVKRPKDPRGGRWVILLLVVIIVAGGVYTFRSSAIVQQIAAKLQHKKLQTNHSTANHFATENTEQDIHFDFYTELPKVQVKPSQPPIAVNNNNPQPAAQNLIVHDPEAPVTTEQYILEIATFKDEVAASEFRISLLLAGSDANIVKIPGNPQTLYRVQQGPYANMRQAKISQQRLAKKGIKGELKKL